MMSAYYSANDSYSRSFNAELAEDAGRLPLTRFCTTYGLIPSQAKRHHNGEWHHVGKYATCVNYYDPEDFCEESDAPGCADLFDECSKPRPSAAALEARRAVRRRVKLDALKTRIRFQLLPSKTTTPRQAMQIKRSAQRRKDLFASLQAEFPVTNELIYRALDRCPLYAPFLRAFIATRIAARTNATPGPSDSGPKEK